MVPGWYSGRTIHIHVMIRSLCSSGSALTECTTQFFLDQTLINALTTSVSPYSSSRLPDTTSAEDSIYSSSTQLTLTTATTGGYAASITIGVQNNLAVLSEPVHAFESKYDLLVFLVPGAILRPPAGEPLGRGWGQHKTCHRGSVPTGGHHGNAHGAHLLLASSLGCRYRHIPCIADLAESARKS
jgi:hypothetical protein